MYKLLKKYPSLPENWTEGMIIEQDKNRNDLYDVPLNSKYFSQKLNYKEVENNPEFWQKVIEKEYEIVKVKLTNFINTILTFENNVCIKRSDDSVILANATKNLDEIINDENVEICSVKRLFDGEIFTIGDTLIDKKNINSGSFKLKKIEFETAPIDKGTGKLNFIHDHRFLGSWIPIENLQKLIKKEKLFTTEDGVDIYAGDKYCLLILEGNKIYNHYIAHNSPNNCNAPYVPSLVFSTKEKAEEYIIMNKPCLSVDYIVKMLEKIRGNNTFVGSIIYDELTKLVKNKINEH